MIMGFPLLMGGKASNGDRAAGWGIDCERC